MSKNFNAHLEGIQGPPIPGSRESIINAMKEQTPITVLMIGVGGVAAFGEALLVLGEEIVHKLHPAIEPIDQQ